MVTTIGQDSLGTRRTLSVDGVSYDYFSLEAAADAGLGDISRLPFSLKCCWKICCATRTVVPLQ